MVARSPPKLMKKPLAPLDPNQIRETVIKVEKCLSRLQELQYITGGTKMKSVVNLSPRSTRGYLKTSLRCKQESFRIRNGNVSQKSPPGKLPSQIGEWKRMSLPAMLLGETVSEILHATQFAREIVYSVNNNKPKKTIISSDPKTPVTNSRRSSRLNPETTELRARRHREKQIIRTDQHSPLLQRARSRINFKVSGSPPKLETEKESCRFSANRVSPKNRPWARKTVIFPNPLFHTSSNSNAQKFCRTNSPVVAKNRPVTPHKFLIKTPPAKKATKCVSPKGSARRAVSPPKKAVVKFQVKIRSPAKCVSPKGSARKVVSPPKKVVSPPKKALSTAAKLRRSFSPSRLASKLVSPLKSRRLSVHKSVDVGGEGMMMNMMSGLKQRPVLMTAPMHMSGRRV